MKFEHVLVWGLLTVSAVMTGCASSDGTGGSKPRDEIVTPSDEPEARKRARIRLELASGYFSEGKTSIALDELKQALAADPNYGDAYNLRGLIYQRLSDPRQAEESFRRAIALNSRDADAAHNYGWMLCQQRRFEEGLAQFNRALAVALYTGQSKTLMTKGLCEIGAGRKSEAELSFRRSLELDASNPITGFNLASLLHERGDNERAQFYIRRINNGEFANAETLWLGARVERAMGNTPGMEQLGTQLKRRFAGSREAGLYDRGAFNEQ
jgi:type IV pilus assembly protein PilF